MPKVDKRAMERSDAPYVSDPGDPAYINHRGKSIKVLTTPRHRRILDRVISFNERTKKWLQEAIRKLYNKN